MAEFEFHIVDGEQQHQWRLDAGDVGVMMSTAPAELVELAEAMSGWRAPWAGEVLVEGHPLSLLSARPHQGRLVHLVTRAGRVLLPMDRPVGKLLAAAVAAPRATTRIAQDSAGLMRLLELPPSTAQRQLIELDAAACIRVALAVALGAGAEVLVMDRPHLWVLPSARTGVLNLLQRLAAEHGITVLWLTDDFTEVPPEVQVLVWQEGRVAAAGTAQELWHEPTAAAVSQLVAAALLADPNREDSRRPRRPHRRIERIADEAPGSSGVDFVND